MTDPDALKVMCIFEASARLKCESELTCLAAYIYHRFFRDKEKGKYDVYAFATAAINLAHRFYDEPCDVKRLLLSMVNVIHGSTFYMDNQIFKKLKQTVYIAERIIATNLEYHLNFKDERMITPMQLQEQYRNRLIEDANRAKQVILIDSEESSSDDDDDRPLPKLDSSLAKNSKYSISSHRYLVHYLKTIQLLLRTDCQQTMEIFEKISNVAWTFLCDYHWRANVTQIYPNHLACACLMMAIETFRVELEKSKVATRYELWCQLNKKWNLILCDDFPNIQRDRAFDSIVLNYNEYDRLMQHELAKTVLDPSSM